MGAPNSTVDQNILPVQAYFNIDGSFNTFIGQGQPFVISATESIGIINTSVNATFYPTFSPVSTGQVTSLDVTSSSFTFNPGTGVLSAPFFSGTLNGTATATTSIANGASSQVLYQVAPGITGFIPNGTSGQFLLSNGTSAPSWATVATSVTIADQTSSSSTFYPLFYSATSGSTNTVQTSSTKYQYIPSTGTLISTVFSGSGASLTGIPLTTGVTGILPIANGGTNNSATPTAGGAVYGTGTALATTAAGTNGQFLQSTGAGAPAWATISSTASTIGIASNSTNASYYPLFYTAATAASATTAYTAANYSFNPSTGTLSVTSLLENTYNIVSQKDIGSAPNQIPLNQYLGNMAYQDKAGVNITGGTATLSTATVTTGTVTNLTTTNGATIQTLTVGLGGGSVASNTVLGLSALNSNSTGANLVAVGYQAGYSNTGSSSVFLGYQAGYSINSGSDAIMIGYQAGRNATTASENIGIGYQVLYNTTSSNNIAIGYKALNATTSGNNNVAIGANNGALKSNTTGQYNIGIGSDVLSVSTTSSNLVAVGSSALYSNTTNVATLGTVTAGTGYTNGTYTGVAMTPVSGATFVTYPTVTVVVAGGVVSTVTLVTNGVGASSTSATVLTVAPALIGGTGSGFSIPVATFQSGTQNTAVGYQAGYSNLTGTNNTFNGYQAGFYSTGAYNTFIGTGAGNGVSGSATGTTNVCIGVQTGYALTTGSLNVIIGSNGTGASYGAGFALSTGSSNVLLGVDAGGTTTTGSTNTFLGRYAGYAVTTGSYNSILGAYTGASAPISVTGSNFVVLSDGQANIVASTKVNQTFALQGGTLSAGTGIAFPATQSASSDVNTLDDYEEGTWTATLQATTTSPTLPVTTTGTYTKIGRQVTISFSFNNVNTLGASGNTYVSGLPFGSPSSAPSFYGTAGIAGLGSTIQLALMLPNVSTISYTTAINLSSFPIVAAASGIYLTTTITYISST